MRRQTSGLLKINQIPIQSNPNWQITSFHAVTRLWVDPRGTLFLGLFWEWQKEREIRFSKKKKHNFRGVFTKKQSATSPY
jgi:hypothetical protein